MANLRTPLYDWHVAHKARMVPFGGWDMPVQYAGIIEEHKAVRAGAGLFDISHMARVDISGPDALPFLESVFTNSVGTMKDGQVRYGLVCGEDGGILDDILVYKWQDDYSAVVNAGNREKILAWWATRAAGKDVKIDDHTTSTQRRRNPSTVVIVTGKSTRNPASSMRYQQTWPSRPPRRASTPSAIMPASTQRSAVVPRGMTSIESTAGRARPMSEAGSHTCHWSR